MTHAPTTSTGRSGWPVAVRHWRSWTAASAASVLLLAACADQAGSPLSPLDAEALAAASDRAAQRTTTSAETTAPEPFEAASAVRLVGSWGPVVSIDPGGLNNINTTALEGCPAEATDGRTLFFASNRDGGQGGIDIWVAQRRDPHDPWREPENLPPPVNSASNDFCPTPLPGGVLLFVSTRPGGCGGAGADIYQTRLHPTKGWLEPENLGCQVNSASNEFSPSYVGAGGGLLFFSSDRDGQDKIYVSVRQPGGSWGPPVEVTELNAQGFSTARPNVSQDGRVIVFDSNRPGGLGGPDIWSAARASVNHAWSAPANLGESVNSAAVETRPWLSRDGKRLYFGSSREGGEGNLDLYVATRR